MSTQNILVPLDYTGCAFHVAATAAGIIRKLGDRATLLYVSEVPLGLDEDDHIFPDGEDTTLGEYLDADARAGLAPVLEIFAEEGVPHRLMLAHGSPGPTILKVAEQLNAGMIVMGTHGRKGIRRLLEGSVCEYVLRESTVPVLAIRTLDASALPDISEARLHARAEADG